MFCLGGDTADGGPGTTRSIIGAWWLFVLVMSAIYAGNLVAFLAVEKHDVPFRTLEELGTQSAYYFGTLGGTLWETILLVKITVK